MKYSPIFSRTARSGPRRLAGWLVSSALVGLALVACADLTSTPRDPDDKPFWERNEQRDD